MQIPQIFYRHTDLPCTIWTDVIITKIIITSILNENIINKGKSYEKKIFSYPRPRVNYFSSFKFEIVSIRPITPSSLRLFPLVKLNDSINLLWVFIVTKNLDLDI